MRWLLWLMVGCTGGDTEATGDDVTDTESAPQTHSESHTELTETDTETQTETDTEVSETELGRDDWYGLGTTRLTLTVAGYDPGSDDYDEAPASVGLDLGTLSGLLALEGHVDPATLQLIRLEDDGSPALPARQAPDALGVHDVPFRFTDVDLWEEGFVTAVASSSDHGELVFAHEQHGEGDTTYQLYFDVVVDPPTATVSPRPTLGDFDMIFAAEGCTRPCS